MNLVILGAGYSGLALIRQAGDRFSRITATARTPEKAQALGGLGADGLVFDGRATTPSIRAAIRTADALLVSIPAEDGGDPALRLLSDEIAAAPNLGWIGYLSTVGVYGDHGGAAVDESAPLRVTSPRGLNRIAAETGWRALADAKRCDLAILRLAGIYGPGRNQLVALREGSARRIIKPGHVFSRIHVEDIAGATLAALARPHRDAIYNVADDEPAPAPDVVAYAARLLGIASPPEEDYATAAMSPMARSFWQDSRRILTGRLRAETGYTMRYPTYREGLAALHAAGEGR